MESLLLEAKPRAKGIKAKHTRLGGRIPAVIYGGGMKNVDVELEYQVFRKLFAKAGESTVIEISVDGAKHPVLVHDVQYDPVTDAVTHVDFIKVDMNKEVAAAIKLVLIGVAPAVKNLGGILDFKKHELHVKCLPKDLVHQIEVDVTGIVDFHTSVHVKDLKLPPGIKPIDNAEDTVVTATPMRVEKEEPVAAAVPVEGVAAAAEGGPAPAAGAAPAAAPGK